ncbi:MAG TPA: asparagine synthase (glutamine-hydrolyzing) [Flavipsychrobacter sp.]|nr:asparagine synthase (glutamine-hydrolyzing) [Flavipsychrobacter sp.]
MCGICGFIATDHSIGMDDLRRMNNAIKHRGPDDEGYALLEDKKIQSYSGADSIAEIKHIYPPLPTGKTALAALGFRRLSILDVSHLGHQPMLNDANNIAITFNGEIYNFKSLRDELKKEGYVFKSESDTEVILHGYRHWGIEIVYKLNGMFAIAILDVSRKKLWLIRDRMGIKPLFYYLIDNKLIWASEIKAILSLDIVSKEVNYEGLAANYLLQTTPSPQTCFKNIVSLPPAHCLEIDMQTLKHNLIAYWSLPEAVNQHQDTASQAEEKVHTLLKRAVEKQLVADVPIVSLMSGGIDSTTITALAAMFNPDIHSYTLGFDSSGKDADEIPQAKSMADKLGIHQHIHIIRPEDITQNLLEELEHFEEPYCGLEIVMNASEHIHQLGYKVALSGNGADEVFGGYSYVLKLKQWQQRKKLKPLQPFIPGIHAFTRKVKSYLDLDTVFQFFINQAQGMREADLQQLGLPKFSEYEPFLVRKLQVKEQHYEHPYETLFAYDMKYSVSSHHVYRDDMSAMRHSLEMRYPFLDHELIESVARLPVRYRYNEKTNKPLLRSIAQHYLTPGNLSMPKKGFSLPGKQWMNGNQDILSFAEQHLERLKKRSIFNRKAIDTYWSQRQDPSTFFKIWQLVTTEVWLNKYIDKI